MCNLLLVSMCVKFLFERIGFRAVQYRCQICVTESSSLQFIENLYNTTHTKPIIKTISSTNLYDFFILFCSLLSLLLSYILFFVWKRQNERCVQNRIKTPTTLDHIKHTKKIAATRNSVDLFSSSRIEIGYINVCYSVGGNRLHKSSCSSKHRKEKLISLPFIQFMVICWWCGGGWTNIEQRKREMKTNLSLDTKLQPSANEWTKKWLATKKKLRIIDAINLLISFDSFQFRWQFEWQPKKKTSKLFFSIMIYPGKNWSTRTRNRCEH